MQAVPKITIITVVRNAVSLIEKTIVSVIQQTYRQVEYIIIDGVSTDGTLAVLEKYRPQIDGIFSEKDNGIYDAMNKGLKRATGEYVLFLNAGDLLADQDVLKKIFSLQPVADVYYGNTKIIDEEGNIIGDRRLAPPEQLTWKSLKYGMCVSHQSFIAKRSVCGWYDPDYKISSDIDWMIRVLKNTKTIVNTHQTISLFLGGGASAKNRWKALAERFKIMSVHYGLINTMLNHLYIVLRYPVHKLTKRTMS